MEPATTIARLARFAARGAGTDAERRAARWLASLVARSGRAVELEPAWVRPGWPLVHSLHAGLGVVASAVSVQHPALGLALATAALASCLLDLLGLAHLGRRLTLERATQNVVSPSPYGGPERIVRLVVVAEYDAGRAGAVYREGVRRAAGRLQSLARGRLPGPFALLALGLAGVAAAAGARLAGAEGSAVGAAQLVPTVLLLVVLAALVDVALARPGRGANDPGSGAAVALALVEALDREPPRRLGVELVLAGAGDGPSLGMRAFVRSRRRRYAPEATAVLALGACGRGRPAWWASDGPLVALRLHPRLGELAASVGPRLEARPHRGRGAGPAWRARLARWPAIAVGCRDEGAWAPGSHRPDDVPERIDPAALDGALALGLAIVRALDEDLDRTTAVA
jgi:hypothetical protein